MPPTAAAQAAYDDFITDKYRANCLTIRDPGECLTCLKKQVSSEDYSLQVLSDVCARPEAPNSPRRACGKDDVWTICNCPGGMQTPPPPGKSTIPASAAACAGQCHPDNIPVCTMGEGNPLGDGYIVGSEYIKNISNTCRGFDTDRLTWGWGTPLTCHTVDKDEVQFTCNDGQWGVQVNNRGDRYAGTINGCVNMDSDDDDECFDKSKGGTCEDDCLTNIFYNTEIYRAVPTGERTTEKGGGGTVYRTVKVPIDEIHFESDVESECEEIPGSFVPGTQISYKCDKKIGTGYSTIMCNGERQGVVVGNYSCPRVDCSILSGVPWQQLYNCSCNSTAPDLPGNPNMVGKYVVGKYSMRSALQGAEDIEWHRCHDQSLASDRTVTQFIGDDDQPSYWQD